MTSLNRARNGIPLHRIAVVRPFTRFLEDIGAPVERGFRRARLPVCALEDVNNYVPSDRFWAFLIDMARREHIEDLGFRVGQSFGANCADPKLSEMLRKSPTLYRGLIKACELTNATVTNCTVGLIPPAREGYICFFHSPSCDVDNPAIEQIGWYGLMTLLGMVREFAGRDWQPTEIGLMTHRAPNRCIRDTFPGSRIRRSQPVSYIEMPASLLSLPPPGPATAVVPTDSEEVQTLPGDFVDSLRTLVATFVEDPGFCIEDAAALCDTSARSLQRNLKKSGTSYSEVLDEARFQVASRMLRQDRMRVTEIASRLGYANPTHFSRAFRRIAGVTPRSYRQAQLR